jgi:hypothetical protein
MIPSFFQVRERQKPYRLIVQTRGNVVVVGSLLLVVVGLKPRSFGCGKFCLKSREHPMTLPDRTSNGFIDKKLKC